MKAHITRRSVLLGAILVFAILALINGSSRSKAGFQTGQQQKNEVKGSEDYKGPIVDYESNSGISSLSSPKQQALKEVRSNRYNHRAPEPLGDFASVTFEISSHWAIGLPPLPIVESDAVVLGKMIGAQAHLSSDKSGVYSEFIVNIKKVFKSPNSAIGDSIVAEREGGVVRFSTGRLLPYKIVGQRLPQLEHEYVLFLKQNEQGEDYHIITGYDIRQNRILPLDEPESFKVFKDMEEEQFFKTLQDAVIDLSKQK